VSGNFFLTKISYQSYILEILKFYDSGRKQRLTGAGKINPENNVCMVLKNEASMVAT
jgi:hypothetical protein